MIMARVLMITVLDYDEHANDCSVFIRAVSAITILETTLLIMEGILPFTTSLRIMMLGMRHYRNVGDYGAHAHGVHNHDDGGRAHTCVGHDHLMAFTIMLNIIV